jgi:hypothetical protein
MIANAKSKNIVSVAAYEESRKENAVSYI